MSEDTQYKKSYERQKKAREVAEQLLETKSRELYDSNQALNQAYQKLKKQKAHALQQEKLASLGQLVAGVAHEINNPTAFVKSNLASLKKYNQSIVALLSEVKELIGLHPDNSISKALMISLDAHDVEFIMEDLEELVDDSIEGTRRVESIVQSLKNFSRSDTDIPELMDVNESIKNTIKLLTSEVKYKADLDVDYAELPEVMGFPGAMSQVFMNLIVNASHAIKDFGRISIKTWAEDQSVKISISDNGQGIPEELVYRVFDPFFTTKDVGVGTGLGLSIVHGIIEKHGGYIGLESKVGEGTCFTISLPMKSS